VAYDGLPRDVVDGGAQVLVVQTNNATYGHTGQPSQQLAMSRLRAVEHGRSVLVAATSGISAIIAPDGRVVHRSQQFTQEVLGADVPLRTATTLADRVGAAPEWALSLLGLAAVAAGLVRRRRAGKDGGAPPQPTSGPGAHAPSRAEVVGSVTGGPAGHWEPASPPEGDVPA